MSEEEKCCTVAIKAEIAIEDDGVINNCAVINYALLTEAQADELFELAAWLDERGKVCPVMIQTESAGYSIGFGCANRQLTSALVKCEGYPGKGSHTFDAEYLIRRLRQMKQQSTNKVVQFTFDEPVEAYSVNGLLHMLENMIDNIQAGYASGVLNAGNKLFHWNIKVKEVKDDRD